MRSIKKLALVLPFVALMSSCSTDFEVNAPYRPYTIVYGLLDMADTAQYIRIQKAFLDEHLSSIDMAQTNDSSYYDPAILSVHLKEMNNGVVLNDYVLDRVDLADEGYPKNVPGSFSGPNKNYAYKYKGPLSYLNSYRLVITNSKTGEVDSAETAVILNQRTPQPFGFTSQQFNDITRIAFSAPGKNVFTLQSNIPSNAGMTEAVLRMHWVNKTGTVQQNDSADYLIPANAFKSSNVIAVYDPYQIDIQNFLKSAVGPASAGTERYLDSTDIYVWAGAVEYTTYVTVNNAQGGLTSDQIHPTYTNIKGRNVLGLFSSRTFIVRRNIGPTYPSLDTLMNKESLKPLNFKGVSDH